jgi:hypothetical protein
MNPQVMVIIIAIGVVGTFSTITYNAPITSALKCDLHINPYGGGVVECPGAPDDLPRSFQNTWPLYGQSGMDNNIFMLNPQPLPPVDCPMCGAIVLDKSLFETNLEIKISPQKDGSIILSTMNSTESLQGSNVTNSLLEIDQ